MLYCSDCGGKMYVFVPEKGGKQPFAQCGNYRKAYEKIERHYNIACATSRRIIVDNILELVRDTIKRIRRLCKNGQGSLREINSGIAVRTADR